MGILVILIDKYFYHPVRCSTVQCFYKYPFLGLMSLACNFLFLQVLSLTNVLVHKLKLKIKNLIVYIFQLVTAFIRTIEQKLYDPDGGHTTTVFCLLSHFSRSCTSSSFKSFWSLSRIFRSMQVHSISFKPF